MPKIRSFRPKNYKKTGSQQLAASSQTVIAADYRDEPEVVQQLSVNTPPMEANNFIGVDNRQTPVLPANPHDVVRMVSLGGVGNVTRNMYVYEYGDDILIVDCGIGFPEVEMLGVDLVLPDISYLKDKKHKIRGIVVSHGHDDHIGGLPYLWPELNVPIYTQKLTAGFIRSKFTEFELPKDQIHAVDIDDHIELGVFKISFYGITHSVPDTTGIIIQTPIGTIVHQADFKIDWTPVIGKSPDLGKLAAAGEQGIVFMTIDCLRVEKQGYTLSEKTIEPTFAEVEAKTAGKVLITTTSSNISRIQQAINVAVRSGRKLVLAGRSMENNFQVGRDLGYLDVPAGLVVPQDEVKRFPDEKLMIIIAGSQGQPGSALSRVANHDHKFIRISDKDSVVFSADPIPGSEIDQGNLIDKLTRIGCTVYASAFESDLHVSGHASQEEVKLMLGLAKPKFVLPIGGSYRHIKAFSNVAVSLGMKQDQVVVIDDGEAIEIGRDFCRKAGKLELQNVYVDGLGVGDVGNIVLRDRQVMSEEGVVVVVLPLDRQRRLAGDPEIISRGFVFEKESGGLLDAGLDVVKSVMRDYQKRDNQSWDWKYLRSQIENNLQKFFYQETNRRPMILPIVVNL